MSTRERLAATIEVLGEPISAGDTMRYRIENTGCAELICGVGYLLERQTSEGWVAINPGMPFRAIGLVLPPGASHELTASVPPDAPAGVYRISTSVSSDYGAATLRVSNEFAVVVG